MITLDSLLARVLQARYYSTGNFMDSALGVNSSFVWHRIWATKGLLQKGCG